LYATFSHFDTVHHCNIRSDRITVYCVVGVLQVHVWTLRNEDRYLAWDFEQDVHNAFKFCLDQKVDGMFTDFPESLTRYLAESYV